MQQVVNGVLYYAHTVDWTVLASIRTIVSEQSHVTEGTENRVQQLLDHLTTQPATTICYYAPEIVLKMHLDASYLSEARAQIMVAGYYFMGGVPNNGHPITPNGNIIIMCGIMKFVVASAAEAEMSALFMKSKDAKVIRLILAETGHTQPLTPIHRDNKTVAGISYDTIKNTLLTIR